MASNSVGGVYQPPASYDRTGATDTGGTYVDAILTNPTIDGVAQSSANDRQIITEVIPIDGDALGAANLTLWTAPADAIILRAVLDVTTASTGASTIDIGYTATTATTTSNTLLDGVSGTPAALFDSMNAALAAGANAKAQRAAAGKWVTADEASGDTAGMVATLYLQYVLV